MMIARWHIDARFGHKQHVIDSLKEWRETIGSQLGWTPDRTRILTGSVGALESTIVAEVQVENLTDLDNAFAKLATLESHKEWGKKLEPYIVSGTPRWEVYRAV